MYVERFRCSCSACAAFGTIDGFLSDKKGDTMGLKTVQDLWKQKESVQLDFIRFGFCSMSFEPLFAVLLGKFLEHPTKSKALLLYELFCIKDKSEFELNADKALAPLNKELVDCMKELQENKDEREAMGWFQRAMTKSKSKKPGKDVFDSFLNGISSGSAGDGALTSLFQAFNPTKELSVQKFGGEHRGPRRGTWRRTPGRSSRSTERNSRMRALMSKT